MARKKELVIETTPRRIPCREVTVTHGFPCGNQIRMLIAYLNEAVTKYGEDALIHINSDYYDDYSAGFEVTITPFRDETEDEVEKRIAKAAKAKERSLVQRVKAKQKEEERKKKQEKDELDLLVKLQKKYKGYDIQEVNTGG